MLLKLFEMVHHQMNLDSRCDGDDNEKDKDFDKSILHQ